MSAPRKDEPAFPTTAGQTVYSYGMTLRDWFAGQALANMADDYNGHAVDPDGTAKAAYVFADAMLEARAKGGDA